MDYRKWYKSWNDTRSFIIENDRLKKKKYFYTPFPKTNRYGFQNGDIRRMIASDILARYNRVNDCNVLYPVGFNSLCNSSYLESKKVSNTISDEVSNVYYGEMRMLAIGINDNKLIEMRHNEFVQNLQQLFIDLYKLGYIEYKQIPVYLDKKNNKIYDVKLYKKTLPQVMMKCFVLNVTNLVSQIVADIKELRTSIDIKNRLISFFKPTVSLKLSIGLTNKTSLNALVREPEYLGGVGFIFLNPDYMDISPYVDDTEAFTVHNFLNHNDSLYCFTGLYAINPLTGKRIPVLLSRMYSVDVYLGIPSVDEEAKLLADNTGFLYDDIIDNGVLINSDFLDGLEPSLAHEKIINSFSEYDLGEKVYSYSHTEINLTSIDNFGPLFPFLEDKEKNVINSLEGYLPYTFSSKLRPTLVEDVDIIGSTLSGTINSLFIDGALPYLSLFYDDIGSVESIFDDGEIEEIKNWFPIVYSPINTDSLESEVVMPIVINNILKKEKGYSIPNVFERIEENYETLDIVERRLDKSNNNLLSIKDLSLTYSLDSIRLFSCLTAMSSHLVIDYDRLDEIEVTLNSFKGNLNNLLDNESGLEDVISNVHKKCTVFLDNCDVYSYSVECYNLLKTLSKRDLSVDNLRMIVKIIYPLIPFLAEEINSGILDARFLLSLTDWN